MTLYQATSQAAGANTTTDAVCHINFVYAAAGRGLVDIRAIDRAAELSRQLRALRELPVDWAGPGTRPISLSIAARVTEAYAILASVGFPVPAVVPTADGSVQLEWHTQRCDVEVEVSEDVVDVYVENLLTGQRTDRTDLRDPRALHAAAVDFVAAL